MKNRVFLHLVRLILLLFIVNGCTTENRSPATSAPTAESIHTPIPTLLATLEPKPTATATLQPVNVLTKNNIHQISMIDSFSYSSDRVSSIAWSSDSNQLAWGTAGGTVYIRQLSDTDNIRTLLGPGPVINSIKWSPDNSQISITTFASRLHIVNETNLEIATMSDIGWINQVKWSIHHKRKQKWSSKTLGYISN